MEKDNKKTDIKDKSQGRKSPYRRAARYLGEFVLVILVLSMLAVAAVAVRVNSSPYEIGFAKEYVEDVLRSPERGTYVTVDKLFIHWPKLHGPLYLLLRDVKILGPDDKAIVSVHEAALSLSRTRLLIGQVSPLAIILRKPALKLVHEKDGTISVGFSPQGEQDAQVVEKQADDQTALAARILDYIGRPGSNDDSTSPLGTLRAFEIYDAELTIEDRTIDALWSLPKLDLSLRSEREGLGASFSMDLSKEGRPPSYARGEVLIDWETKESDFKARFENFDVATLTEKIPQLSGYSNNTGRLTADINASLDENLVPVSVDLKANMPEGQLVVPELSDEPVLYKDFLVETSYADSGINIAKAHITIQDVQVNAQANLAYNETSLEGPLKVWMEGVSEDSIDALWPKTLEGDSSEEWIVEKIKAGQFHDVSAEMNLVFEKNEEEGWIADAQNIKAAFAFDNATVDYRPPMFPVTEAKGRGTFDNDAEKLSVTIESGKIKDLNVEGAQLEFNNIIEKGAGKADINVKIAGPLKTGFEYVSLEPITLDHDFDLEKVAGNAVLDVNVKFPTTHNIKVEDVKVIAKGTLNDVVLPDVIKDFDLTGGPFAMDIEGDTFKLKGKGKVGGRPADISYEEFINSAGKAYTSKVQASLTADQEMREALGIDLSEFLSGSVPAEVTYTSFAGGRSEAYIKADISPARFYVDPFDYEKQPGAEGSATLTAKLQNGNLQEIVDLHAEAPRFSMESGTLYFREAGGETELNGGEAPQVSIDETIGSVKFEIEPAGRLKIVFDGAFIDLRPFLDDEDEEKNKVYDSPPMVFTVKADQMRTADKETVQYGKIYADIDAQGSFIQLEMDAIVGGGDIYLRYKPDETGARTFRLEADNAGAALKAFDLYDNIQGGKLVIYGEPIRGVYDRNLKGVAEIRDFRVVKAPILARLLGAMSVPGLLNSLGNEGIGFSRLESRFDWLYRRRGSLLVLKEGRTSGNAMGLTFDGTFDKSAKTLDVSGTVVPISGVNKMLSDIPVVGDILSGGSGSIFAATYSMKGNVEDPRVNVNPLAVLAPGILRRILFE